MSFYEESLGIEERPQELGLYESSIAVSESEDKPINPNFDFGGADAVLSTVTSAAAPIVGGLTGGATALATQDIDSARAVQDATTDAFTFPPQTETGEELVSQLAELMRPVTEFIDSIGTKAADSTFALGEDQASAVLAAGVKAAPAAVAALIPGSRGLRAATPSLEKSLRSNKPAKVAESVDPDLAVVGAADRLDIDLEPGTVSQNKSFVELTQSLKSKPGNPLAVTELEAIEALSEKGKSLINQDRADFSDTVKADFQQTISDLNTETHKLHENIVPDRTISVELDDSAKYIVDALNEVGDNFKDLSKVERHLLDLVDRDGATYGSVDRVRRNIGKAYQGKGVYAEIDGKILDDVYGAIARDQMRAADKVGSGDSLRLANELVVQRKGLEQQTLNLFGKDLQTTLVSKISQSRAQLSKGDLTAFRKLIDDVPEKFQKDAAGLVIDALMGDAKGRFSLGGFAGVVETFKRSPSVKREVLSRLDAAERQVFDDMSTVTAAIQRTKSRENNSRTARDVMAGLEDPGFIKKLYEGGRDIVRAESLGSAAGVPGVGTAAVFASKRLGGKKNAADDATELLTSSRFRLALRKISEDKISEADRIVLGSKEYGRWAKNNPKAVKQIAVTGFFAWASQNDG